MENERLLNASAAEEEADLHMNKMAAIIGKSISAQKYLLLNPLQYTAEGSSTSAHRNQLIFIYPNERNSTRFMFVLKKKIIKSDSIARKFTFKRALCP